VAETLVAELKGVAEAARTAVRAVRDLEREMGGDVFGRYVIESGEAISDVEDEIGEFLRHARHLYPDQELTLLVIAKVEDS
jgi:hypothetical protein